jgi:hypothetical protein
MHRRREFGFIDEEPHRLAGRVGLVERFIGMALKAGRVGIFLGSNRAAPGRQEKHGDEKPGQRRNPKAENRRPKEGRKPKSEFPKPNVASDLVR